MRCCKKNATNFIQNRLVQFWYMEKRFRLNPAEKCYKRGGDSAVVPHEAASTLILRGFRSSGGGGASAADFWAKTVPKLYQNSVILGIFDLL